jgi:hypothetical protein
VAGVDQNIRKSLATEAHGITRKKNKKTLMATESTEEHGKIKLMSYIQMRRAHWREKDSCRVFWGQ